MKNLKKHSPLKKNPLRNPGQSLDEKIQDVIYDSVLPYFFVSLFLIAITLIQWSEQIFDTPPNPLLWTFIALVFIGYSLIKMRDSWRVIKNTRLGRDGERFVGQNLEQMRKLGYQVFHDIVDLDKTFNIDHVLVGPAGVFSIETKTISKTSGIQKIQCKGDAITYDGYIPHRNPIHQAKSQARWLESFLLEAIGERMTVKPVVVFPEWFVESHDSSIWVLNEKSLVAFIKNEEAVLSEEKIDLISAQVAKYNRKTIR